MEPMDETTTRAVASPPPARPDGFAGQRMVVVAAPAVTAARTHPALRHLTVTDAGVFPHAVRHGRTRPRGAEQDVLLVCTDGAGWCRTAAGRAVVRRGDAVLLPRGRAHEYGASDEDPWTLWWLHVAGDAAADLVRAAHAAAGGPVAHLRDPAGVASLVQQAIDALDAGTPGDLLRASGAAWNALAQVAATGRRTPGPALDPVERALEHLRATTPRRTSLDELAALVGLSPSHLAAVFRQRVGVAPLRYQSDLRLARARELLDSTSLTVAEVAATSGYADPLYFSRQFARTHGVPPTAYRSRAA